MYPTCTPWLDSCAAAEDASGCAAKLKPGARDAVPCSAMEVTRGPLRTMGAAGAVKILRHSAQCRSARKTTDPWVASTMDHTL